MNLIIVESPTKAKTLERFLGSGYKVDSTKGHIKDLPKSKLGIDLEKNFTPDYEVVERQKPVITALKNEAKQADIVYIATDPDREGEAIAAHVQQIINNRSSIIKRIVFHEITKEAVETALAHPRKVNEDLVQAQIARRVLDRLVGYSLSPVLWKKVRRGLSAGRVQSVAVRLIVEKEREIEKFKPEEFWQIFAAVHSGVSADSTSGVFVVKLVEKVGNKARADKIIEELGNCRYKVLDVKKRQVIRNPYPPFTTSTMTQAAARIFGWSAKRTMRAAQSLYEEGFITYHRTDSLNLNSAAVEAARKYIKKEYGKNYLPAKARFYKTSSKSAQEAHEAIRPTNVSNLPNGKNKLYDLIWRRFVACQMSAAIYSKTAIDVEAIGHQPLAIKHLLRASGQTMEFDGWRKLIPTTKDSSGVSLGSPEGFSVLPQVKKGEKLDLVSIKGKPSFGRKVWGDQKFTQPPARYNEASLIKVLEKLGIGRPSTYAPIISTIQIRSYVEKKEGKFYPTPVGMAVIKFLLDNFEKEVDYGFTADMEEGLDDIANGRLVWQDMIKSFWEPFDKKVQEVTKKSKRVKIETEKLREKCPKCRKGELVIRIGRFGKFVSCSRFPECKHTEKYIEKVGIKCPDCKKGDVIIKKSFKGKRFFGCSRYPKCKWASWRKPAKEDK